MHPTLTAVLTGVAASVPLLAQTPRFSEVPFSAFPSITTDAVTVTVLDADGDGRLDAVLGGANGLDRLYLQVGDGPRFAHRSGGRLPRTWVRQREAIVPADVDGDGDQDLLTIDYSGTNRLLINDGTGRFVDTPGRIPSGMSITTAAFFDADGDGDLDLVTADPDLFLNDGSGRFATLANPPLPPQQTPLTALHPCDADLDGDIDLFVTSRLRLGLYRNVANTGFVFESLSTSVRDRTVFGDITGDGFVDAVGHEFSSTVWINDGTGRLVADSARTVAAAVGSAGAIALADCDGDGDLDLLVGSRPIQLSLNDGTGRFTDAGLAIPWSGMVHEFGIGDFDGDGDDDAIAGTNGHPDGLLLGDPVRGLVHVAPAGPLLIPVADEDRAMVIAAADLDGDGLTEVVIGERLFSAAGGGRLGFAGFLTSSPASYQRHNALAIGDLDGDGRLDVVSADIRIRYRRNQGALSFVDASHNLPAGGAACEDIDLFDADGDGDLDLLGTGGTSATIGLLWSNDGTGAFTDVSAALPTVAVAASRGAAAADFDGDGDLDLAIGRSLHDVLFENVGGGQFVDASADWPTPHAVTIDVVAFDADGDGDVDLFTATAGGQDRLYENDGSGRFTDRTAAWIPVDLADTWSAKAGDVDEDGDLDLVLGGGPAGDRALINDGSGRFTPASIGGFNDLALGLVLTDLDGDGDLDVATARTADGLRHDTMDRVWWNRTRHVHLLSPARPGLPLVVEYHALAAAGAGDALVLPWFALGTQQQPVRIPGLEPFWLDPATMFPDDPGMVPAAGGVLTRTFSLPAAPGLLGVDLAVQMLVDHRATPPRYRLSNVATTPIVF